jgi:hypothetical protein
LGAPAVSFETPALSPSADFGYSPFVPFRHALLAAFVVAAVLPVAAGCGRDRSTVRFRRDAGIVSSDGGDDGGTLLHDLGFRCTPGERACAGPVLYTCGPDGASRIDEVTCDNACDPTLGCVLCRPGTRRCEGAVSLACAPSGLTWVYGRDCSEWGSSCGGDGFCDDACGRAEAAKSNVGCEYWPSPIANTSELDGTVFDYRVVVANPSATDPANVRVTRGATVAAMQTVPPGGLAEIRLPWIEGQSLALSATGWQAFTTPNGAYRLTSDRPVTVMQFNPFEYAQGSSFSYTNDASLLLPQHVLTGDYVGASYLPLSRTTGTTGGFLPMPPTSLKYPGYIAIVGTTPTPTTVAIALSGNAAADRGGRWPATPRGGTITFTLARGEVAHVLAAVPPDCRPGSPGYQRVEYECTFGICNYFDVCREADFDLTGSRIAADQPVVVYGGHACAYIPNSAQACDHLEAQLPPIQTWGRTFESAPMVDPATPRPNVVRVAAAFPGTSVTVEPATFAAPRTLGQGEWMEFEVSGPFRVSADKAIQVTQYMVGQYYGGMDARRGDPAMTILVPREQFRSDYTFVTPTSYNPGTNGQSFVLVSRPPGLAITLDGGPLSTTWQPIGDRELGIVPVAGGTHTMRASEPFGIILYGLGSFTSYAAPGGLNLEQITIILI